MSDRARIIQAMLEDPLNLACFLREYAVRNFQQVRILGPATDTRQGMIIFPCFRDILLLNKPPEDWAREFEIYELGPGWYITRTSDQLETGPFPTLQVAKAQAKLLAEDGGYLVLEKIPWATDTLQ